MTNARTALLVVFAATLALIAWLWNELPARVASHFGIQGNADATSSRETLLATFAVAAVLETLLFLGIPILIRRSPPDRISLPNRQHWLAPERREATLEELGARLTWLGVLSGLFLLALVWEVGRANLAPGPDGVATLGPVFWTALATLTVALVMWLRSLLSRFASVPRESS